jgi:3-dehydroquinate dehydratase/shikimate dehydrogenase
MAQVIASIHATSREQVLADARRAAMAGADWLELRLDRWPRGADLAAAIGAIRLPVLVACRTPEDGGAFRGTLGERRELLSAALEAGAVGLDLEHWESWAPPAGRTRLRLRIRSFHSFTGVPKELAGIRDSLHSHAGTVAKIAVTAHDVADCAPLLELLRATDQAAQPTVAFAMGRTAWPSRILAAVAGAPFVYGSLGEGEDTAPGQPRVELLAGLFRVPALSASTAVYGLLGNPALQSLGPWLHNRALLRLDQDAVYLPFETSRPELVVSMLAPLRLRGLSVTSPHKGAMAARCHRLDDDASAAAAVNTIVFDGAGAMVGRNTDIAGVLAALQTVATPAGQGRRAAVLGTGGAGRAAAVALQRLGYAVTMLGRSPDAQRAFAAARGITLASLSERVLAECAPAVIVQATPVGGAGRDADERLLPGFRPAAGTIALELNYQPRWTRWLRDAAAAGAVPVPGIEMFLAQAAGQLEAWTGRKVDAAALRRHLAGTVVSGDP